MKAWDRFCLLLVRKSLIRQLKRIAAEKERGGEDHIDSDCGFELLFELATPAQRYELKYE